MVVFDILFQTWEIVMNYLLVFTLFNAPIPKTFGFKMAYSLKCYDWHQMFEYETLWLVLVSIRIFSNDWLIDSWCSVSQSVEFVSDRCFDGLSGSSKFDFIFDLNWQVSLCCESPLRLCISISAAFSELKDLFTPLKLLLVYSKLKYLEIYGLFDEVSNWYRQFKFNKVN